LNVRIENNLKGNKMNGKKLISLYVGSIAAVATAGIASGPVGSAIFAAPTESSLRGCFATGGSSLPERPELNVSEAHAISGYPLVPVP
jgi:hypothetical protein